MMSKFENCDHEFKQINHIRYWPDPDDYVFECKKCGKVEHYRYQYDPKDLVEG